jgi:hypothetical protein
MKSLTTFATTEAQQTQIIKAAKKAGQTVSTYCREAVMDRINGELVYLQEVPTEDLIDIVEAAGYVVER